MDVDAKEWQLCIFKVHAGHKFAGRGCITIIGHYDPKTDTSESYIEDINDGLRACVSYRDRDPYLYIQLPDPALLDDYEQIIVDGLGDHAGKLLSHVYLFEVEN